MVVVVMVNPSTSSASHQTTSSSPHSPQSIALPANPCTKPDTHIHIVPTTLHTPTHIRTLQEHELGEVWLQHSANQLLAQSDNHSIVNLSTCMQIDTRGTCGTSGTGESLCGSGGGGGGVVCAYRGGVEGQRGSRAVDYSSLVHTSTLYPCTSVRQHSHSLTHTRLSRPRRRRNN